MMESNGLSDDLHRIVVLTESGGRQMAQSCLLPNSVVEIPMYSMTSDLACSRMANRL